MGSVFLGTVFPFQSQADELDTSKGVTTQPRVRAGVSTRRAPDIRSRELHVRNEGLPGKQ